MSEGPAGESIAAAIEDAGGAIAFSEFQRLALYGPGGFYTAAGDAGDPGGRAGRRPGGRAGRGAGDFLTSPEVGPLFGAVLARYVDERWSELGRPDPFTVVDAGAGPGSLARAVLAAEPACRGALRYVAVEISAAQRALHPDGIESVAELPEGAFTGVIVANELLDNLPFRLCVYDAAWREAYVALDGEVPEAFVEVLSAPFEPLPSALPATAAHGARAPLLDEAVAWLATACRQLAAGSVLAIDYVRPTTAELAALDWRRWLRTYRGHARGGHYLDAPGTQDITVDLAADQLPEPDAVRAQAQFLQRYGIDDLVAEGRAGWAVGAATGGLDAIRMRSRLGEAEALLDPAGLGGFTVLEYRR